MQTTLKQAGEHLVPPAGTRASFQVRRTLLVVAPYAGVLAAWYLVTRLGAVDPVFLPPPGGVFDGFLRLLSGQFFSEHLGPSALRVSVAFLLSVAVALPLGILSSQRQWVSRMIEPLFGFSRYLPVAALVPLCILWFGIGDGQKIAVIFIGVVFQLTLLFTVDLVMVPKELVEAGRTFGLKEPEVVWRIVLPSALPALWDHMRISAGWAWSYLVLAELVAGNKGVGYFVIQSQRYLETNNVFAGILFIGILGALTDLLFRAAGRRFFRWV
jgi:NitT/TauT family transport system permease protein